MSFIFNRFSPIIGLQLNGNTVKCLELGKVSGGITIVGAVYQALPKNVMVNDSIIAKEALSKIISDSVKKPTYGSFTTRRVAISLPETKCFVRVMQLPLMSEEELSNAIAFEAEAYIPVPIDQVYFDWQIVKRRADGLDVVIFASPKELVDIIIKVVEASGLHLVAIETESKSLERALTSSVVAETSLVVDLDASRTNLVMVDNGVVQFTSSIPIAGNTFTERISSQMGITTQEGEKIKKQAGVASTPDYPNIQTILSPLLRNLSAEIQNVIQYHYDHSGNHIQKLILSGGGAKMKHLSEFLTRELKQLDGTKIEVASPWNNLPSIQGLDMTFGDYDMLDFIVPLGLSMRSIHQSKT